MNTPPTRREIEHELTALTDGPGEAEPVVLWRAALEHASRSGERRHPGGRTVRTPRPWRALVALNAVGVAALVLLAALPVLRPASREQPSMSALSESMPAPEFAPVPDGESFAAVESKSAADGLAQMPQAVGRGIGLDDAQARMSMADGGRVADAAARQIARRAVLSVEVADAEAASREAASLTDQGAGEYVESSLISGPAGSRLAEVSLRVMPGRVDAVLGSLRSLGRVEGEATQSDDLTVQAADLDAQLRSAERAEADLSELLRMRADEPMGVVVEAQRELVPMRESVERLRSVRAALASRVVLAEVRVTLVERSAPREGMGWLPRVGSALSAGLGDAAGLSAWAVRMTAALIPVWVVALSVWAWWALRRRSRMAAQL